MAKSKKKEKDPIKAIKKMEEEKRTAAPIEKEVHFDVWWAQRRRIIPRFHAKEVILANFKAWGLGPTATFKEYDEALQKYGIIF